MTTALYKDIELGKVSEALNNKLDLPMVNTTQIPQDASDFVIASQDPTAENNYSWYRLYKSGWVEQGGKYSTPNQVIALPITMQNAEYQIMLSYQTTSTNGAQYAGLSYKNRTTISFTTVNSGTITGEWQVSGYANTSGLDISVNEDNKTQPRYNITNCITEIQQDIKLELNSDGTLALKKGSVIYIPDGKNSDGTLKFIQKVLDQDHTREAGIGVDQFIADDLNVGLGACYTNKIYVQDTKPTGTGWWYDTANNYFYNLSDNNKRSLPIGYCVSTAKVQPFNGVGYCKNLMWFLPGLKALIPNGRNADGTLNNNITSTNDSVILRIFSSTLDSAGMRCQIGFGFQPSITRQVFYNIEENRNYDTNGSWDCAVLGRCNTESGIIKDVVISTPYFITDFNNTSQIAYQSFPSRTAINLTLGSSGTTYTAPAEGYFTFERGTTNAQGYISFYNLTNMMSCKGITIGGISNAAIQMPVVKGDVVKVEYNANTNNPPFKFIYANGVI